MKMTAWRFITSGPGYRYLDSWSWHVETTKYSKYSIGDQYYWTIAIILAICDTFTVVVASQALLLGYQPHVCMHACLCAFKEIL